MYLLEEVVKLHVKSLGKEYTKDLPQGGMEIPCHYTFQVDVQNLKMFFAIRFPFNDRIVAEHIQLPLYS